MKVSKMTRPAALAKTRRRSAHRAWRIQDADATAKQTPPFQSLTA